MIRDLDDKVLEQLNLSDNQIKSCHFGTWCWLKMLAILIKVKTDQSFCFWYLKGNKDVCLRIVKKNTNRK